ncbi:HAD family hydrolase [Bacillus sp. T33-2]|uniref:HAD family hydrolase n=1 Tax=Bacillus sp. T33-2 TaxID=2054168 RepID=UPI000C77C34E|nr:HAD family hydrolase [Bacillus sp. T33-2]PLR95140.1 HAD family hydrolase [Bacillus sp. T33-2]
MQGRLCIVLKAIIFDFDGTLADTLPICFYAFQSVFKHFDGRDLSAEEIKQMFGPSETGIIRENLLSADKELAIELFYHSYLEKHSDFVKRVLEIDDLLLDIKARGLMLGVVTGKARRSLDISLKQLEMDNLFDVIITGDDVIQPKPHPEGLLKAIQFLGVDKEDTIFVGDSDADILAGKQAEVVTAGVQWLPNYDALEFTVAPDRIFNSVQDLTETLFRKSSIRGSV